MDKRIIKKGEYYHVFNKSIAGFKIFSLGINCQRYLMALGYYNNIQQTEKLSAVIKKGLYIYNNPLITNEFNIIKLLSYCLMPTHYHLLVKILDDDLFSQYIANIENSYSRFFNLKFHRKGPLWESRYKAVRIRSDEQLLHVSRYIHLNPTTAYLVERPEDWQFSSYKDIITDDYFLNKELTDFSMKSKEAYKKFVENNIYYQKTLKIIKNYLLD